MAKVAADALLASEGWDLAKVLAALDYWSESGRHAAYPALSAPGTLPHDRAGPDNGAEALAALALIRAYAARDMYTARHILARWAGTLEEAQDFAAIVANSHRWRWPGGRTATGRRPGRRGRRTPDLPGGRANRLAA